MQIGAKFNGTWESWSFSWEFEQIVCVCFGFGFHVWRAPAAIASFFGRDIGHILIETFGKVVWICVFDVRVQSRQISP